MKRMISTKAATVAESIKDFVKQNRNTTEFGGNVEIDGNLTVNGTSPGGAAIYKHTLTINGYGKDFFTVFYLSNNRKATSLDDLKILLGSTFKLPTNGAISTGALGSGYYFATYLDETALHVANMSDEKIISYGAITLTDNVITI